MLKQLILSTLDRFGVETNRSTTLKRFLASHPIDLVIDAGANLGQFAQSIRKKGYTGPIWSFEPVGSVYRHLEKVASKDHDWRVSHMGLGSSNEDRLLNVPHNHVLSSFLMPSETMATYDTDGPMRTELVRVTRLDDVLADDNSANILLKLDVQGFERQVLEGAKETLKRTHAIYIELPIEHLYEGGWTFPEAISYLDDLGFTPAQFRTVQPSLIDRASAVEFDCLLRRKK